MSETPQENGPWSVNEDGSVIMSDDFTHDVWLRVSGDFYGDEQRKKYAQLIAGRLNALSAAEQRAEAMRFALAGLLADIEDYQTINNLGGENNHWQVIARKALADYAAIASGAGESGNEN